MHRSSTRKPRAVRAVVAAAVLAVVAAFAVPAFAAAPAVPQRLVDQLATCQDVKAAATTAHLKAWAEDCEAGVQAAIDAWIAAHPEPTATATPTAVPTTMPPTTTPPATTPPATTLPPTTAPPTTTPPGPSWPGATNTGVPAGTVLTAYTGPCTITAANTVVDAKTITCAQLLIRAAGVIVTRSRITATADPAVGVVSGDLMITDSTILAAVNTTGLGDNHWIGTRLNISGGNRGANCDSTCKLADSWLHGNRVSGTTHASGLRAGQFTTAVHNTLNCDAPADNCSADLTGYPDFATTHDWTITGNLFVATHAGGSYFCSYGGASAGKPFSNAAANAVNIQFRDNVYGRGAFGLCGGYHDSSPFADYDKSKAGFVFSGNHYDDGTPITA